VTTRSPWAKFGDSFLKKNRGFSPEIWISVAFFRPSPQKKDWNLLLQDRKKKKRVKVITSEH